MGNKDVNDSTDVFDVRLHAMQNGHASIVEVDAAIAVYERVRTAKSICQALLAEPCSEASVIALVVEIGAQVRSSKN